MRVGHSDTSPLPHFQWTNQAFWKTTTCRSGVAEKAVATSDVSQSLPCSRIEHASCLLGHHVYLFGGKDRYMPLKDLWRLDLENGRWESITFKDTKVPHLQGHTMVSYRSQIFIFGGSFGESPDDTPLWIYSPDLNHVRKYVCEPLHPCPVGRREHSAVVYKNSMYVYGGFFNSSGSTNELWAFNLETEEWSSLPRLRNGKRHGHVAVVYHHAMWVHGGMRGFDCLSDLWVYNFDLFTWTKIKTIGRSPALSHHTSHVVNNSIVLVGGSQKSVPSSCVWIYGIGNNTWRQVDVDQSHLFSPVFFHTSVLIQTQNIFINSKDTPSQSTPHLKSHLSETETVNPPVRPWTSPSANNTNLSIPSYHSPSNTYHPVVNVLTMHSNDNQDPLTDKNNNSEENLFSFMECNFKSAIPEAIEMKEFNCYAEKNLDGFNKSANESHVQYSSCKKPCIRPASLEHCNDDVPLLQRFSSVSSDVDLGENNAVITISDENIHVESLSDRTGECNDQCSFEYNNPAFLPVISSFSSSNADSKSISSDHSNLHNVLYSPMKSNDLIPLVKTQQVSETTNKDQPSNVYSTYVINETHHLSEHSSTNHDSITSCQSTDTYDQEEFQNFFNYLDSSKLKISQSLDDMILEDIELSNNENNLIRDLSLVSPSTPFIKSSSLKDVSYIGSSVDEEKFNTSHPFYVDSPRRIHSNSCSSLTVIFNKYKSVSDYPSSTREQTSFRNTNHITAEKSGKYIKYQANLTHRHRCWSDRRRSGMHGQLQKMITLKKSAATQTGSQLSLSSHEKSPKTTVTMEGNDSRNGNKGEHFSPPVSESNHTEVENGLSFFSDCKYLLFVLGGQMETPTFTKTPMNIWKCKIF